MTNHTLRSDIRSLLHLLDTKAAHISCVRALMINPLGKTIAEMKILCTFGSDAQLFQVVSNFISYLDLTEESDNGRVFHPVKVAAKDDHKDDLNKILSSIRCAARPEGTEEGELCNRDGCQGTMEYPLAENCSCHINPPCSSCTSVLLTCTECHFEVN